MTLRPTPIFAFLKVAPLLCLAVALMLLAYVITFLFLFPALVVAGLAGYRYLSTRCWRYLITADIVRVQQGIFLKRVDQVELYRLKDYIVLQPFLLQVFGLMHLVLKSTDQENPVLWLRGIPASTLVDTIRNLVQEARKNNHIIELNR